MTAARAFLTTIPKSGTHLLTTFLLRDRIRELSRERSELHRGKWQLRHEIDALNARLQRSEGVESPSLSSAKRS